MKIIKVDLPKELKTVELHIFADEHIGDPHSDLEALQKRIDHVRDTENAYCLLNGDLIDNATTTSVGDTYTQTASPMEQINTALRMLEPIKNKILAITHGNHEARTYRKEGIDISYVMAVQLGLFERYSPTSALIFLKLGHNLSHSGEYKQCYTIYMLHGSGGGRKEGAKAVRLADMASIIDTDIYIHSHTHLPMTMKQAYHRIDKQNQAVRIVDKLFVNTASNLNYGGYGEAQEFKPASKVTPVIYLSGNAKEMVAKL